MGKAATKPAVPGCRFESHVAPRMTATETRTLNAKRTIQSCVWRSATPWRSPRIRRVGAPSNGVRHAGNSLVRRTTARFVAARFRSPMPRSSLLALLLSLSSAPIAACGGGSGGIPALSADRESGQSALMDKTVAGANKCNPKNHNRPFVIEWDATDMSSFESKAENDVVVVKYEGCDLQVLDGCTPAVKGSFGAYGAVEWTSGSVEKIDVTNEGELYAKLPLGAGSLGGRVTAGEQFHMEYYVSGTRTLTRQEVYRKDLDKITACQGATHFVPAFNLGAFALASTKNVHAEAGGTVWGIGAKGNKTSTNNAEKKGGVLTSCTGDSAREVTTCKVPIRLTLREITEGENPQAAEATAPDTSAAMNLAGRVDQKIQLDGAAKARIDGALEKQRAGDGPGCIKELDAYDKANRNATQLSTNPKFHYSQVRAQCVMMAGQCDAGRAQLRKAAEAQMSAYMGPPQIDSFVDMMAGKFCRGTLSPHDQLLTASAQLQDGANVHKLDAATCNRAWDTVKRLAQTVQPKDDEDYQIKMATNVDMMAGNAARCLGRAGDCDAAYKLRNETRHAVPSFNPIREFEANVPLCKGKVVAQTPRDQLLVASNQLRDGAYSDKVDVATCTGAWESFKRVLPTLPAGGAPDAALKSSVSGGPRNAAICMGKAGDCTNAFKVFADDWDSRRPNAATRPDVVRRNFEATVPACKGK